MSKSLFENLTNDEYKTITWILENPGSFPADRFFEDPAIDGRVDELQRLNFVTINESGGLHITELGRAAIAEYKHAKFAKYRHVIFEWIRFLIPTIISVIALLRS